MLRKRKRKGAPSRRSREEAQSMKLVSGRFGSGC
jgi:hypothetical protein